MRFTRFLAPKSLELLDFRIAVRAGACPHCGGSESLIAHGYLCGHAEEGHDGATRALRFFARTAIRN
jgi:hypothetical protein